MVIVDSAEINGCIRPTLPDINAIFIDNNTHNQLALEFTCM